MLPEFAGQSGSFTWLFNAAAGLSAAAMLGPVASKAVRAHLFEKWATDRLSSQVKFCKVWDDGNTLEDEDGGLTRVIELEGADVGSISSDDRRQLLEDRQRLLERLGELGVEPTVISPRRVEPLVPIVQHEQPILRGIDEAWEAQWSESLCNRHYLILSVKNSRAVPILNDAVNEARKQLIEFFPRVLGEVSHERSDLLTFYARLLNPGTNVVIGSFRDDIKRRLIGSDVFFPEGTGLIEFRRGQKKVFIQGVGIDTWGDGNDDSMVDELLSVDSELTVVHHLKPYSKAASESKVLVRKQQQWDARIRPGVMAQYEDALELVGAGSEFRQQLCDHQMTVFVQAEDLDTLASKVRLVEDRLKKYGVMSVIEGDEVAAGWFSMFPGRRHLYRSKLLFCANVAACATFNGVHPGWDRSAFGEGPLIRLRPVSGSGAVNFQIHEEPPSKLGHYVMVARTGAGKTVFISFMTLGALRHKKVRVFSFDRREGMYIFTKAAGGAYLSLSGDDDGLTQRCQINPLQLELTVENKKFLRKWLKMLGKGEGPMVDDAISMMLRSLETLPMADRQLKKVYPTHFQGVGDFGENLRKWVEGSEYATIFNGEVDTLSQSVHAFRMATFDTKGITDDEEVAAPLLMYAMHVIETESVKAGAPFLFNIDEASAALRNKLFREMFMERLEEWRKLDGVVGVAFQRYERLEELQIEEALKDQTATQIFFRSKKANKAKLAEWGCTDREIGFITFGNMREAALRRSILIKQMNLSQAASIDLRPLGDWFKLLNSDARAVRMFKKFERDDPANAVRRFMEYDGPYDADGVAERGMEKARRMVRRRKIGAVAEVRV